MADLVSAGALAAFAQVIAIDLMLAGDNVVVLGTLAAGLPAADRKRVLTLGVGVALVFLVVFALLATVLLNVVGLLLGGGLLLLWVAWKLFRELRAGSHGEPVGDDEARAAAPGKSFAQAAFQVALADLSMSLDNVLAVAGAAREHPAVLVFGLALSVTLMALAANLIARFIERHRWVAYGGLAVILYVAAGMVYEGLVDPATGVLQFLGRPA